MGKALTTSCSRWSAGFARLFGDAWYGRGAFARLAEASRWRVVLVECAVLALVCGGFYLLRYQASVQSCRSGLEATSEALRATVLELEVERRALHAEQERLEVLSGLVLDKEGRARLLSELTVASAHPGLEFVSVSPQSEETAGRYVRCRTLMAFSGGFEDLVRFLRRIEAAGTPCAVLQVEVESRWDSEKPERFSLLTETYGEADPETSKPEPGR
jgi:Tfp pilus assembly protein PilO